MYRFLTKENQDGWEIIKNKLIEANSDIDIPSDLGIPTQVTSTIGEKYVCNTSIKVTQITENGKNSFVIKYNRINLAILFKGLTVNSASLSSISTEGIIEYFENSHIYLDKNCKFILDKSKGEEYDCFWIKANENNLIFYGEILIKLIDKRRDLAKTITNNTINFSPNGQLWLAPYWSASEYVASNGFINDLRYETSRLGTSKDGLSRFAIDKFTYDNFDLIYDFEGGKYVSDYSNKHGEFLTRLLKTHHNWYAYGYVREVNDDAVLPFEINVAECKILYNGKKILDHNSEFYRPCIWGENVILLKPTHKRYSYLYTRTISFGYS